MFYLLYLQVMDFELSKEDMEIVKGVNKELRLFQFNYYGKQKYAAYFTFNKRILR